MGRDAAGEERLTRLALAAGRGDQDAATELIRATQRDVWRFLVHLADPVAAEDLAQETYLRALAALPSFAGRSSARTWLLSIARRVAADHIRTARRRPRVSSAVDLTAAADRRVSTTSASTDLVELRMLLDALSPERREALILTQVLGLSYADAAEVLGCAVGTIRSRVARARDDLLAADPLRHRRSS